MPNPSHSQHPRTRVWAAAAMVLTSVCGTALPAAAAPQGGSSVTNPGILQGIADDQNAANCHPASSPGKYDQQLGADVKAPDSGDAKSNAKAIVEEAERRGLPIEAAEIGVSTAMVESDLTNVGYGDEGQGVTNPDGSATTSVGLFQQQEFWGSREDRMNPAKSAGLFYEHLTAFDWKSMDQGSAAQKVQGSAFPGKYGQRMSAAKQMVQEVSEGGYKANEDAAKDNKDSGGDSKPASGNGGDQASCNSGGQDGGGNTGKGEASGKGDDYPDEWKNNCGAVDPWGLISCQCVSWAAWRFNEQKNSKSEPWAFTMDTVNAMGQGNGYQWGEAFKSAGYKVDKEPAIGSGVWWDKNVGAAGEMGHLAIVEDTDKEGNRVYVSQYNAAPKLEAYSEQWYNIDDLSGFIHYADTSDTWGHPDKK